MSLAPGLRAAVERAVGARIASAESVRGGDVAKATCLVFGDGRSAFLKTSTTAPAGAFSAEARGLRWLAETGALALPEVLAVGAGAGAEGFLLLAWVERGTPAADRDERLGRGLAEMHRAGWPRFGGPAPEGFLANLPVDDRATDDLARFWGEQRLLPLLLRAEARGCTSSAMRRGIERLVARLPDRVGPAEPPSRLHGDLWAGNAMVDQAGAPVLVDPAAFAGHREIDLAMMRLFGGFGGRVFAAYEEAWPLPDGWEARVPLWQLAPLLVHVVLFGGSYVGQVEAALRAIG